MLCWCFITGRPGESGNNYTVVNVTNEQDYFLDISWDPLLLGPVQYYVIEYNNFSVTANSTESYVPVNCSSAYIIYVIAISPCGMEGPRVHVATVYTSVCEPSNTMAVRASELLHVCNIMSLIYACFCAWSSIAIATCTYIPPTIKPGRGICCMSCPGYVCKLWYELCKFLPVIM